MREIILPNGQFARIRSITALDFIRSFDSDLGKMLERISILVTEIDDVPLTVEMLSRMPVDCGMQLLNAVALEIHDTKKRHVPD